MIGSIIVEKIHVTFLKNHPEYRESVIKKRILFDLRDQTLNLGICLDVCDEPYKISIVETKTDVYECSDNGTIKITNKESNESKIDLVNFKLNHNSNIILTNYPTKKVKLFGLDGIERSIRLFVMESGSRITCLHGPAGCGKWLLLRNLESEFPDKQFIWPNNVSIFMRPGYLQSVYERILTSKRDVVVCIENVHRIEGDPITDLMILLTEFMKDRAPRPLKVIVTCTDMKLLPRDMQTMAKDFFVPMLSSKERLEYLQYLMSLHSRGGEHGLDGLDKLAKSVRGFTASDIALFVRLAVHDYGQPLTVEQLMGAQRNKIHVPMNLHAIVDNIERVGWADIGGYETVKETIKDEIQVPLLTGRRVAKGILLYGPPGCSKTMFARALTNECKLNLFVVIPSNIMSGFVGESEARLREIFIQATASAPSLIFIDEIDVLIPKREENCSPVTARLLCELMIFMDGCGRKRGEQVIIMAATNRIERLDDALLRSGRFDLKIKVDLPDQDSRESILRLVFADQTLNVAPEVIESIPRLGAALRGRSGADIVQVGTAIKKICRREWRGKEGLAHVSMEHVREVIPL